MVEKERLSSLDILRGLVLFLLVFFQPLLWSVGGMVDTPWMDRILYQFNHEIWEGFRLWDMVMPMFLFMHLWMHFLAQQGLETLENFIQIQIQPLRV